MSEPTAASNELITAARLWFDAGFCVVPSHEDGSKRPFGPWKQYQGARLPWNELEQLLATGKYTGIGVITGAASGNVELIEIEGPNAQAVERLKKVIDQSTEYGDPDITELVNRITRGCIAKSAGGGLHFFTRVTDGPALGNTKLAMDPDNKVIAETRGEGGFVIVAPTPGRNGHPEGAAYIFARGTDPAGTPDISSDDRDVLHYLFNTALNQAPIEPVPAPRTPSTQPSTPRDGTSTFDAYRATPWADILQPQGWTYAHHHDGRDNWVRPGKTVAEGISATTIEDGPLYVFSSNAGLPTERGLSKADVYAHYNHGGNLTEAARALSDLGYGETQYNRLAEFIITPSSPDNDDDEESDLKHLAYQRLVKEAALKLKIGKDAKTLLARIELGKIAPLEGIGLDQFLQQEDEEENYRIQGLWPSEGRVLLAAAAKSGKTTMVIGNLIPSLVDGTPFLGQFDITPIEKRIVLFNMEVGPRTLRTWARKAGIASSNKVTIVNLRGNASALQLSTEEGRKRLADFLHQEDAEIVILDPLAPVLASLGLDENDNSQIAQFFSWWSETLALAGVRDDLVVHHTGHDGERSRGASRLLDEPDAIWTLKRVQAEEDPEAEFQPLDRRFLNAYGRDVELSESALAFDPETGRLTLEGGSPKQVLERDRSRRYYQDIERYLEGHPGASSNAVVEAVTGKKESLLYALKMMAEEGLIDTIFESGRARHALNDTPDLKREKK
jgi:hypothetical protein